MGRFDVDDEYRHEQEVATRQTKDTQAFIDALSRSGFERFQRFASRPSSTPMSPPLRGSVRWTISLDAIRHIQLYSKANVDEFLQELHSAIPWAGVLRSAFLVKFAGIPVLVFADDWQKDVTRALNARQPLFAGHARKRRIAEQELRELIRRRQATMRTARPVRYVRLYSVSEIEGYDYLDWELFVTSNGLFSIKETHASMRDRIIRDMKAWKYKLE